MKLIGFLEFFALRIHKFALRIILHQVDFGFQFRLEFEILPMLVFYTNRFKGLNKYKVTLLVTKVSGRGGPGKREFVNKTRHFVISENWFPFD